MDTAIVSTPPGGLSLRQRLQPATQQGRLTFKDLAAEILEMIFRNCDVEYDSENECGRPMMALIVALRPQLDQYFQALDVFYKLIEEEDYFHYSFYNLKYSFGGMSFQGWGFSMIKRINIEIPAIKDKQGRIGVAYDPACLKSIMLRTSITDVKLRLLMDEINPHSESTYDNFITDFSKWLAGFKGLKTLEVAIPTPEKPQTSGWDVLEAKLRSYEELVGAGISERVAVELDNYSRFVVTRNVQGERPYPGCEVAHDPTATTRYVDEDLVLIWSWRAEVGKVMDWSNLPREGQTG